MSRTITLCATEAPDMAKSSLDAVQPGKGLGMSDRVTNQAIKPPSRTPEIASALPVEVLREVQRANRTPRPLGCGTRRFCGVVVSPWGGQCADVAVVRVHAAGER